MTTHKPEKILWLFTGNTEVESMVNMARDFFLPQLPEEWSESENIMYSNVKECTSFGASSYFVESADWRGDMTTLIGKGREVFLSAYHEGDVEDADIIVTNSEYISILCQVMKFSSKARRGKKLARAPICFISPKIEEGDDFEILPPHNEIYWWFLATQPNMWCMVLDSDWEVESATTYLRQVAPKARTDRIKRLIFYKWAGFINSEDRKVDRAVWQGRNNNDKGIKPSFEVLTMLSGLGYDCEAFISSSSVGGALNLDKMANLFKVNQGLKQSEYQDRIRPAKVCTISSQSEAWPPGYFEMIDRGIVPVILKRPWMKTFLTDKWPLVFEKVPEAVEMCRDVIDNYDHYRDMLDKCMSERYAPDPNFGDVFREVWDSYLKETHRSYSLSAK